MWPILQTFKAAVLFRHYRPQSITIASARRWVRQFKRPDQKHVCLLLDKVIYLSEKNTKQILVEQNTALVKRLLAAGLKPKQLIYVTVDEPGSSSGVMLSILRDHAGRAPVCIGGFDIDTKFHRQLNGFQFLTGKGAE